MSLFSNNDTVQHENNRFLGNISDELKVCGVYIYFVRMRRLLYTLYTTDTLNYSLVFSYRNLNKLSI